MDKNEGQLSQLKSLFGNHTQIKTQKRGRCVDCPKILLKIEGFLFSSNKLNKINPPKRVQIRGKKTSWYCQDCQKYICKHGNCWN